MHGSMHVEGAAGGGGQRAVHSSLTFDAGQRLAVLHALVHLAGLQSRGRLMAVYHVISCTAPCCYAPSNAKAPPQLTDACEGVTVAMMSGLSGALALLELGAAARHSQHTRLEGHGREGVRVRS